jgi:mannose-6-phosphate isomerase-like protein (cupin superfamily)
MSEIPAVPATPPSVLVVPPDAGRPLSAFGSRAVFKLEGPDTAGSLCLAIAETPPGAGPPPHMQHGEDEVFVVLQGTLEFLTDSGWVEAPAGTVAFVPRGARHTFRNAGAIPSRHLVMVLPSGFEDFYGEAAGLFAAGRPDPARLGALAAKYGHQFLTSDPRVTGQK